MHARCMPTAANAFRGAGLNKQYAQAWTEAFASPGSLLEKNFSLLGPGDTDKKEEPLMKVRASACADGFVGGGILMLCSPGGSWRRSTAISFMQAAGAMCR
eukprot:scaffold299901_cov21-Tisochrysis_lutea.AAC.1